MSDNASGVGEVKKPVGLCPNSIDVSKRLYTCEAKKGLA